MCRSGAEFLCPRHGGFLQTVADHVDSVFPSPLVPGVVGQLTGSIFFPLPQRWNRQLTTVVPVRAVVHRYGRDSKGPAPREESPSRWEPSRRVPVSRESKGFPSLPDRRIGSQRVNSGAEPARDPHLLTERFLVSIARSKPTTFQVVIL
jgi:hypothetical protein